MRKDKRKGIAQEKQDSDKRRRDSERPLAEAAGAVSKRQRLAAWKRKQKEATSRIQQSNGSAYNAETSDVAGVSLSESSFFASCSNTAINGGQFTADSSSNRNRTNVTINIHNGQPRESVCAHEPLPIDPTIFSEHTGPLLNYTALDAADSSLTQPNRRTKHPSESTNGNNGKYPATELADVLECGFDIYCRHLLLKKRGYPLWIPEPNHNLHIQYQRNGIFIGDVGMLTASGTFDYLFNVFLSKDHPFNAGRVPPNFTPLSPRPDSIDIRAQFVFKSSSYVASQGVKRTVRDSSDYGSGVCFRFSASGEGAILAIPDGALSEDLENVAPLRRYIGQNIESWYHYANGTRGRELSNGDLRVIIGTDKTTAWGMAAFPSSLPEESKELAFKLLMPNGAAPAAKIYDWEVHSGPAEVQTGPDLREIQILSMGDPDRVADARAYENQCIFVRTLNPTLQNAIWRELIAQLDVPASSDGDGEPIISDSQSSSGASHSSSRDTGSQGIDVHEGNLEGLAAPVDVADSGVTVYQSVAPTYLSSHPSRLLNAAILQAEDPNTKAVITSDFDWILALDDDEVVMPNQDDLLERIKRTFCAHQYTEGVLTMESISAPAPTTTSMSSSSAESAQLLTPLVFPTTQSDLVEIPDLSSGDGLSPLKHVLYNWDAMSLSQPHRPPASSDANHFESGAQKVIITAPRPRMSSTQQAQSFRDVLDLPFAHGGPFIPQKMYVPHHGTDHKRYVEEVLLEEPFYFICEGNSTKQYGISLKDAIHSRTRQLTDRDTAAFPDGKSSVSIRIEWPGYRPWSRQIPTKDFQVPPQPVTLGEIAKRVAKCVARFIQERKNDPYEDNTDICWRVGDAYLDIQVDDLALVTLHHVSQGSWQPQLRLMRPRRTRADADLRGVQVSGRLIGI